MPHTAQGRFWNFNEVEQDGTSYYDKKVKNWIADADIIYKIN